MYKYSPLCHIDQRRLKLQLYSRIACRPSRSGTSSKCRVWPEIVLKIEETSSVEHFKKSNGRFETSGYDSTFNPFGHKWQFIERSSEDYWNFGKDSKFAGWFESQIWAGGGTGGALAPPSFEDF